MRRLGWYGLGSRQRLDARKSRHLEVKIPTSGEIGQKWATRFFFGATCGRGRVARRFLALLDLGRLRRFCGLAESARAGLVLVPLAVAQPGGRRSDADSELDRSWWSPMGRDRRRGDRL